MEVEIGKEALRFENAAFSYYGMPSLIPPLPTGECTHEEEDKQSIEAVSVIAVIMMNVTTARGQR